MKKVDLLIKDANEIVTLKGPKRARKGKEMLEAGAKEIISKPITRGKLVEIIRKYLK